MYDLARTAQNTAWIMQRFGRSDNAERSSENKNLTDTLVTDENQPERWKNNLIDDTSFQKAQVGLMEMGIYKNHDHVNLASETTSQP